MQTAGRSLATKAQGDPPLTRHEKTILGSLDPEKRSDPLQRTAGDLLKRPKMLPPPRFLSDPEERDSTVPPSAPGRWLGLTATRLASTGPRLLSEFDRMHRVAASTGSPRRRPKAEGQRSLV